LQSAWNKYGEGSFETFCLEICDDTDLFEREQHWINETNCLDSKFGYNINPRADRIAHTQSQKEKISLAMLGKPRRKGIPSGLTKVSGGKWNVLLTFRGKKFYLGTFASYKDALQARKDSLSRIESGEEPDWDHLDLLRVKPKRIVKCSLDGKVIKEYSSVGEVFNDGYLPNSVGRCCRGWCHTYKGYRWRYSGEEWEYKRC